MVTSATPPASLHPHTKRLVIVCIALTYFLGLMARVPNYDDRLAGFLFSLVMDTIIVALILIFLHFVMRARSLELNLFAFVVTLAASAASTAIILTTAHVIRSFFPAVANNYQSRPLVVFAYLTLLFCAWGAAAFWIKSEKRLTEEAVNAANAERAAAVSEVRRLRMQLDPHFLFNALNTAVVEVAHQPKRAVLMLRELSSYLRYSLDTSDTNFVPVAEELAMLRSFMRIQDIRFGAKLKYNVAADEAVKRVSIPTFLLQPLVENAVKYGVPDDDNILTIEVAITRRDGDLVVSVSNSGDLAAACSALAGTGTGLANLRARLALHYPDRHSFEMTQAGRIVCATCVLKGEPC